MHKRATLSLNSKRKRIESFDTFSVVLLDESCIKGSLLKRSLLEFKYSLAEHISHRDKLLHSVTTYKPDVLIIGIDLPDDELLNTVAELNHHYPLPIVMFAEQGAPNFIKRVVQAGISAFIVDDLQPQRLPAIITIAIERFRINRALVNELDQTKTKLEERKLVDKAKGLIMKQHGIDEDSAYKKLRKLSMDRGQSISKTCQSIIDAFNLMSI